MGVNIRKNKKANIIGLTILPKRTPSCIHALLKGDNKESLKMAANKKNMLKIKKTTAYTEDA